jgi:hypothetical protein
LAQIGQPRGTSFGIFTRLLETGADAVLFLGMGGAQAREFEQFA